MEERNIERCTEKDKEVLNRMFLKIFSELAMISKEVEELKERAEARRKEVDEFGKS